VPAVNAIAVVPVENVYPVAIVIPGYAMVSVPFVTSSVTANVSVLAMVTFEP
jgi:hypothetical protein